MSDREKNILEKLSATIPKLDRENQKYILGIAEGMALLRECQVPQQIQQTG